MNSATTREYYETTLGACACVRLSMVRVGGVHAICSRERDPTAGKSTFCVDKRYQNLQPIGKGAYGLVASATDTVTGRSVAIKRISRVFADLTGAPPSSRARGTLRPPHRPFPLTAPHADAKRILRETKLLRHLAGHDNVIDLVDIMTGPPETEKFDTLYLVSTLFEADVHRIVQSKQLSAPPPCRPAAPPHPAHPHARRELTDQHGVYFLYQLLRGLKFIHSANVLHRDIKPSNLLVNSNCDLVICDLGLARGFSVQAEAALTEYVVTRWYRAPEVLCELPAYGTKVDVWAAGCILAEVLGRGPLLRGSSTKDQLQLIVAMLGSPSEEDVAWITCKPALALVRDMGFVRPASPWKDRFPRASPLALDLLSRLLVFNPDKRISVDDALAHPYLAQLHNRTATPEPVCARPFDFSFEAPYEGGVMPVEVQQKLMWSELVAIRAAQRREFAAAGIKY